MKIIFLMVSLLSTPLIFANEEKALKAIEKLGENLQLELSRAMRKSPTYAVAICNIKASEITKKAAKEGIKIGRVSPKNRNPDNTPKDWMLEYIEQFQNKKIDKPYIVTAISSEKMGLLKPIITQPLCTKCHGLKSKLHCTLQISN